MRVNGRRALRVRIFAMTFLVVVAAVGVVAALANQGIGLALGGLGGFHCRAGFSASRARP